MSALCITLPALLFAHLDVAGSAVLAARIPQLVSALVIRLRARSPHAAHNHRPTEARAVLCGHPGPHGTKAEDENVSRHPKAFQFSNLV